ncbi:MAG TPA: methylated-DNA--[protein]-cysteine S-methyltransferase [Candidatus Binatia bacterium]
MSRRECLTLRLDRVETPIGVMLLLEDAEGRLRALDWEDHEPRMTRLLHRAQKSYEIREGDGSTANVARVRRYLAGDLRALDEIPVETGGTEFQRRVWQALREIPPGTTTTYGALAARLGQPTATRAVGLANGSNPVGVVVPCHRVIGADGSLTGYGGGLFRKRWLLEHEGVVLPEQRELSSARV